ncbi:MAG TPA: cupin domain-containing protein [Chloroflexaceae bacterium]|nr:cupin domain-containing protein [Chloroflexaceae bacterium]
MNLVRLNDLQLPELGYTNDDDARVSGTFPFSAATGNTSTAMVYFELAPGKRLPTHADSSEEILFVIEGLAEISVGDERAQARAGDLAVVPAMAPHGVRNVGDTLLRVLGFFPSPTVMSTFGAPLVPLNAPVGGPSPFGERTLLAPLPVLLEQAQVAAD